MLPGSAQAERWRSPRRLPRQKNQTTDCLSMALCRPRSVLRVFFHRPRVAGQPGCTNSQLLFQMAKTTNDGHAAPWAKASGRTAAGARGRHCTSAPGGSRPQRNRSRTDHSCVGIGGVEREARPASLPGRSATAGLHRSHRPPAADSAKSAARIASIGQWVVNKAVQNCLAIARWCGKARSSPRERMQRPPFQPNMPGT